MYFPKWGINDYANNSPTSTNKRLRSKTWVLRNLGSIPYIVFFFFWYNVRISFFFHNFWLCLIQPCEKVKSRYCHRMDRSSGGHPTPLHTPVVVLSVSIFPEVGFSWWRMSDRGSRRKKSGFQTWVEWGPVTQAFHTGKEGRCGERPSQQAI